MTEQRPRDLAELFDWGSDTISAASDLHCAVGSSAINAARSRLAMRLLTPPTISPELQRDLTVSSDPSRDAQAGAIAGVPARHPIDIIEAQGWNVLSVAVYGTREQIGLQVSLSNAMVAKQLPQQPAYQQWCADLRILVVALRNKDTLRANWSSVDPICARFPSAARQSPDHGAPHLAAVPKPNGALQHLLEVVLDRVWSNRDQAHTGNQGAALGATMCLPCIHRAVAATSHSATFWSPPEVELNVFKQIRPMSAEQLGTEGFSEFVAVSESARRAATAALQFLNQSGPILIVAPTGCGKEKLVQDLHRIHAHASKGQGLLTIAGGEIATEPGWGQLVGVEKNAATGVSARKGLIAQAGNNILVIDEFHAVPEHRQYDLLRVLDPHNADYAPIGWDGARQPVQAKIVACTSENLWQMSTNDKFIKPLLQRFSGSVVWIPPLHERIEDIGAILQQFLGKHQLSVSDAESDSVAAYVADQQWDGRQLRKQLETRHNISPNQTLAEMFPEIASLVSEDARRCQIVELLTQEKGNVSAVAKLLPKSANQSDEARRKQLERECRRLGINPQDYQQ